MGSSLTPGSNNGRSILRAIASAFLLLLLCPVPRTFGGVINTYAGGGNGDGAASYDAILDPRGMVAVGSPNSPDLYICDGRNHRVRRVDGDTGLIETIAGTGDSGFAGDGGSAVNARLNLPLDVAVDSAGNVYIADMSNNRIRKVTPNGQISTYAGNGNLSYSGDGGLATQAAINNPYGVTIGPDGYLYIADFGNNRIRKVGPPGCVPSTCVITTAVGSGDYGYADGPAATAVLRQPADMAFDSNGNMLIADWGNHRIRKVSNGLVTTLAGGGIIVNGSLGDGGPALQGVLRYPIQIDVDSSNNIYIADSLHRTIRMVTTSPLGIPLIYTVAGTGNAGSAGDGGPATRADMDSTSGIAVTAPGSFFVGATADLARSQYNRVRRVIDGTIYPWTGGGLSEGGAAYDALIDPRGAVAVTGQGQTPDVYFADGVNNIVRMIDGATATITTIAGTAIAGYSGDGGAATLAQLKSPLDVAVDAAGNVYIADTSNNVIRRVTPKGIISTVAGNGTRGFSGDGGRATSAQFASPTGIGIDRNGRLYIADNENQRVRMVNSDGIISTIAGNGDANFAGDNGPATQASLRNPDDVAVADDGTIFIADTWNHRIRRIDANGIITTYAGYPGGIQTGFGGDGSVATDFAVKLYAPTMLSVDKTGRLFFADSKNYRVRTVDPTTHIISTVAGNGTASYGGDGKSATSASFSEPTGVAVDPYAQELFISANNDGRIRIVDLDLGGPPPPPPTPTPTLTATAIPPTATRTPTTIPGTATRTPTTNNQTASILGTINYYAGSQSAVSAVDVDLSGSAATVQTNSRGDYAATNLQAGTWTVEPAKTGGFGNAISSLDAARVLQVVAGLTTFTDKQRLACDTTGDGSLSALDAVRILQFSAGVITQFPVAAACGSDWMFSPAAAQFPNQAITSPSLSGGVCQQGAITLRSLSSTASDQDFVGILFGDCTGNWTSGASLKQVVGSTRVIAGNPHTARGGVVRVPIYVQGPGAFHALDLRLAYDDSAADFVAAVPHAGAAGALVTQRATDGILSVSLASGQPIDPALGATLVLEFRATGAVAPRVIAAQVDEQLARPLTQTR